MLESLKQEVFEQNLQLVKSGLVVLTWGNVSGIDRSKGLFVIKPSGVPYEALTVEDMVVMDLEGKKVEGRMNPSTDTATHAELYRRFAQIGGVVHTHSRWATVWAQAGRAIPAYGTTHADTFHGPVPVTRDLTPEEVDSAYELETGRVIAALFEATGLHPLHTPAVLARSHGPFTWGRSAADAVHNAIALEEIAMMAWHTEALPQAQTRPELPEHIAEKHFLRKHGPNAYYGQQ